MNSKILIALLILLTFSCQTKENKNPITTNANDLGLIPQPQHLTIQKGVFLFDTNSHFILDKNIDERIVKFIKKRFKNNAISSKFVKNSIVLHKIASDTLTQPEGYSIDILSNKIDINATTDQGLFYALQTLSQLLPNTLTADKKYHIPALQIYDQPQFVWRGAHLDVSRHFFDINYIKKYIDLLAKHKMNIFHWHLVDDQGWRIEIKQYPKLTEIGSHRKATVIKKNFKPFISDHKPYGGYYTQEQIKEIVAYAHERFVTVVPEIEMPGHSLAALAAYPQYSCTQKPIEVGQKWGIFKDIYCAGNDSTFVFLENILDEVVSLFPSKYIHIGGDEAPKTRWKECAKCQQRIKTEHLKDEHELQSYFITRIEKYLNSKGRQIIGWDEILEGGLAPNAAVMSWRGEKGGIAAAKQNHYVVMTPGKPLYFDHYQSKNRDSEPFAIGGFNSLQAVYEYNPVPKEIPAENAKYILGAQANLWTEYISTPEHADYMAYPRLSALSEVVWTGNNKPGFDNFMKRMKIHSQRLQNWQVHYRHFH
jgi:hexosaminidase